MTTVDVDQAVLERASEILGTLTKKDTINGALRAVIRQRAAAVMVEWMAHGEGVEPEALTDAC